MKVFRSALLFAPAIVSSLHPSLPHRHSIRTTSSASPFSLKMAPSSNSSTTGTADLNRAKQRISQAISSGAPAYNAGDVRRCAELYADAAREIAPLLPPSLRTKLLQTDDCATTADDDGNANYDAKAWALRRAFDSIVEYQLPLVPREIAEDEEMSFEKFSANQLGGEPVGVMDGVMGGISRGSWIAKSNTFFGETSLANNGGFASLRWRFPTTQNWSYAKGLYFKGLRHSNAREHTFKIILKDATCERVRLANFKTMVANPDQVVDQPLLIPFSEFDQMEQMGRPMVGSPGFNPSSATEIGIMAIKPTVVGDFQLEFTEWGLYV